jgi:hypothetical protein
MPTTIRVLAQAYPTATVETTLYTCATTSAVISTLTICNNSATADAITMRICVGGAGDSNEQLILSGTTVGGNGVLALTVGITMENTDVIKVTSANGTSAFNLFGQENS